MGFPKPERVTLCESRGSRPHQEDRAVANATPGLYVVADGFGGAGSGAEAARVACDAVAEFVAKTIRDRDSTFPFVYKMHLSVQGNVLFNALVYANRKLMEWNSRRPLSLQGGCSLLAGYLKEDRMVLAGLGVCSAWAIRGGELRELVVPKGRFRMDDPFQSFSEGSVGDLPLGSLGVGEGFEPEITEVCVQPGDRLSLQTDGVTDYVRTILGSGASGIEVEADLERFSFKDNISLILLDF